MIFWIFDFLKVMFNLRDLTTHQNYQKWLWNNVGAVKVAQSLEHSHYSSFNWRFGNLIFRQGNIWSVIHNNYTKLSKKAFKQCWSTSNYSCFDDGLNIRFSQSDIWPQRPNNQPKLSKMDFKQCWGSGRSAAIGALLLLIYLLAFGFNVLCLLNVISDQRDLTT
jgi:hypothetical protein